MEIRVHANTEYELEKLLWGQGLRVFRFVSSMGYGEELVNYPHLTPTAFEVEA